MEIMLLGTMHIALDNNFDIDHLSNEDKMVSSNHNFEQFVQLLAQYEPD